MQSQILINEFFPDPVGADKGWEWIEIVNISDEKVNLTNWEIQVGGVSYNRAFRFPDESIVDAGEYILICETYVSSCDYYTTTLGMQNGIGKTDGVRLLNSSGNIVNTVLYSRPNRNNLKNDHGEIEKDEKIIEIPGEGFSFSRREFSNTGFSIEDFFISSTPTPGSENTQEILQGKVVLSEIGYDFVEFFSTNIPDNLEKWYFKDSKESLEKVFLQNSLRNNFFVVDTKKPFKQIFLYSPQGTLVDHFSTSILSPNYTLCRLNSSDQEEFSFCEKTLGEKNIAKVWKPTNILEILQRNSNDSFITNSCVLYKHGNIFVISDESAAMGIRCNDCKEKECFLGELSSMSEIFKIQVVDLRKIEHEKVNKENYASMLHKVVFLEGSVYKNFSVIQTDFGIVKIEKDLVEKEGSYYLKGIFTKESSGDFKLEYATVLEKKDLEKKLVLEQTGDPVIFLIFFFLIPFLLSKIFVKLSTIKF